MQWPKLTVVTPTLNAAKVLGLELESISIQDYPKELVEIIVADGGSSDSTVEIAEKYGATIVSNPLKTAEAGKAVGVREAIGKYVILLDSDNILPTKSWLKEMVGPLEEHSDAVGSEPWEYIWRKEDSFITRYSALIGMNDPLVHFLGNYDRRNLLTGKWTEVPREEQDKGDYLLVRLDKRGVPTIGANGTVFRADYLRKNLEGDYLFDIDIIAKTIHKEGSVEFIKVKNGIIHTFCEGDVSKFARKQRRRVKDYLFHKSRGDRSYEWQTSRNVRGLIKFIFSCVTVIPLIYQSIKGYTRKGDFAWLFHPLACEITFWEYGMGTIRGFFSKSQLSREGWKQ